MRNEKWFIFIYPAYVISFMSVLGILSDIMFGTKTPDYMIGIYKLSAIWCLTIYTYLIIKAIWKSN